MNLGMQAYLECLGIVMVSVLCAVLGSIYKIPFLDSAATTLFGVGVGYLAGQSRQKASQ